MRKIISFVHMSLDGFAAGPNRELNWAKVDEDLFNYVGKRISESNTAMYGRATYQLMESYWPTAGDKPNATRHDIEHAKWYKAVHKVILSTTLPDGIPTTEIIRDNVVARINKIKQQPGGEILVFGSPTATKELMRLGLVDGIWMFLNPIILGRGISLFPELKDRMKLALLNSKQFSSGVIELNYSVERA